MRFTTHKRRNPPAVIIVSLIDVLIVVLIFLMVSTSFKKQEPILKLTLPDSRESKPGSSADAKPIVISITASYPFIYLENKPVMLDRLQNELIAAVKKNPQTKASVKADKSAPVGELVKVIDACKAAQVAGLSIVTEKKAGP